MQSTIRGFYYCRIGLLLCFLAFVCWKVSSAKQGRGGSSDPPPKTAEAAFHNIQVLKDIPNTELPPVMHFIRSSLGVRCEFCHVAEEGKYYLDVKKEKQRAREMILMTRKINEANFGGRTIVTCNTCHQGATIPNPNPLLGSKYVNIIRRGPDEPQPDALPSVADVLARYEAAAHIGSLKSARVKYEGCHARLVNPGTPNARAISRADCDKAEVLIELGAERDRVVGTASLPNGSYLTIGNNGNRIWTVGPDGVRWLSDAEFVQSQRKLDPFLVLRIRPADFASTSLSGVSKIINGVDAYTVSAIGADGFTQELSFSKNDDLLIRRTFYHPIAMGLEPEQFDLSDYKSFGGIKLPSQINISYLDDQHLGILKKLIDVKLDVPTSDKDFQPHDR